MPKLIYYDSDGVDKSVDLGAEPTLIGRAGECHVQTQDALVSRRHARIVWDGGYWIEDLGSSNGVWIAGERVQRAPIRPGDEVRCGSLMMKLVPDVTRSPASRPATVSLQPPESVRKAAAVPAQQSRPSRPPMPPLSPQAVTMMPGPPLAPAPQADEEHLRRVQAEAAVLTAEQRAAGAESRLAEVEARLREGETRLRESEARLRAAETVARDAAERAKTSEQAARDGDRLRRQVDQLRAEVRLLRGGTVEEVTSTDRVPATPMVDEVTVERDDLRRRVAELEAERDAKHEEKHDAKHDASPQARLAGGPEALAATDDALADLRASLRAARDEVGVLAGDPAVAAGESVHVLTDALAAAADQIETARARLKELRTILGR